MALIKPEQLRSGSYNITGSFTGSFYGDGSNIVGIVSASYATSASFVTNTPFATSASYAVSSSYAANTPFATSASYAETASIAYTASYVSSSNIDGVILSASYALTASYALNGGGGGSNIDTGSFATTGSNTFIGNQIITGSIHQSGTFYPDQIDWFSSSIGYDTGSYILTTTNNGLTVYANYQDVANGLTPYISTVSTSISASYADIANSVNDLNQNVFVSGTLTVLGGATFYGSSSFVYITASQLDVSASFISVNVFEPAQRFGGLKVYDSGSSTATASLAWDSLHNHWVYENVDGATYTGGMLLSGPRNTGSLGDEPNLTKWFVPRGDGGDHLNDSQIFTSASITQITGSLTVTEGITGSLSGSALTATSASFASTASFVQTAQTASYVLNAVSSSFATSASYASQALSASYAPSNVISTILYNSTSPVSVTGITSETLIASVPIPTNISNTTLRASFIVVVTTLGGAAPRTRMRIGTIANPTSVQLSSQTQLGTNGVGSANAVSMYRTMPVVGGSSGNIKVIVAGSNVNADYGTITTYDTISVNWTTQQYIYFTIVNNTTAAVTQCYGVLLEQLKQ